MDGQVAWQVELVVKPGALDKPGYFYPTPINVKKAHIGFQGLM
jgi:hypothetical protein